MDGGRSTIASDDEFRNKLLLKFKWDLGEKQLESLIDLIEERLVYHGDGSGILPDDSRGALPDLLQQVIEHIRLNNKFPLRRKDFLDAFANSATIRIPKSEYHQLTAFAATQKSIATNSPSLKALVDTALKQFIGGEQAALAINYDSPISVVDGSSPRLLFGSPVPVADGSSPRTKLVQTQTDIIQIERILIIHGSSGLGKTNLATQITRNIGGEWNRAGLRGLTPEVVRNILRVGYFAVHGRSIEPFFVLDDLDFSQSREFEGELTSFVDLIREIRGYLIITSPYNPPVSIFPKFELSDDAIHEIPYMDESEISDTIKLHGLSDEPSVKDWARVIRIFSHGHPQLVHARVRSQSQKGWQALSPEEALSAPDFSEVQRNFRNYLTQELDTEDARRLLYRLSIISGSFARSTAIKIAECPPAISLPGEVFEKLIGPWVEDEGKEKYRVSPLLMSSANHVLNIREIKAVHSIIADSIISQKSLNEFEVFEAFIHAFYSEYSNPVTILSSRIIQLNTEQLQNFTFVGDLIVGMGPDERKLLPNDPSVEILFRLAQIKIAETRGKKPDVIRLVNTVSGLIKNIQQVRGKQAVIAMAYSIILTQAEVALPPETTIPMLLGIRDVIENTEELADLASNFPKSFPDLRISDNNHFAQTLFLLEAYRVSGVEHLEKIINTLDELSNDERVFLIGTFNLNVDFAGDLISCAWIKEVNKEEYDTSNLIRVFDKLIDMSQAWNCNNLLKEAIIAKTIILDEYMEKSDQALSIIEEGLVKFPNDIYLLNQKAKIFFHQEKYTQAAIIYDVIWENDEMHDKANVFMLKLAGICAAKINSLKKVEIFFNRAADIVGRVENPHSRAPALQAGFQAEAALAIWERGEWSEALKKFKVVLSLLENIPITEDLYSHYLYASVGNALTCIYNEASEAENQTAGEYLTKPFVGMFTNTDPGEDILNYGTRDIHTLWEILSYTEQNLELDLGIYEYTRRKFTEPPTTLLVGRQRLVMLDNCWKKGDFSLLISRTVSVFEIMAHNKQHAGRIDIGTMREEIAPLPSQYWKDNFEHILWRIIGASLVLTILEPEENLPLEQWVSDAETSVALIQEFTDFIGVLGGQQPVNDAYQLAAASILYLRQNDTTPTELWGAFFRVLNILAHWHGQDGKEEINEALDRLVVKHWSLVANNQGFRFSNPSYVCPEIIGMCNNKNMSGIFKLASILDISAPALSIPLDESAREALRKVIELNT
ncbi:MAG: hypothetical protein V6Z81_10395 [Parvularculales bacterium]